MVLPAALIFLVASLNLGTTVNQDFRNTVGGAQAAQSFQEQIKRNADAAIARK